LIPKVVYICHFVTVVADKNKAILGGVGAGGLALVTGSVVRALSLGFKSYFKITYPLSVRKSEIEQLNESILRMKKGMYIVVTGEKGNGKTCLIDTTLNRHFGVVTISVSCLSYSTSYVSV
jgi:hypothetical protein